jgi:hypothetical protein
MDGSWLQELRGGEGIREIGEEGGMERTGARGKKEGRKTPLQLGCFLYPCPDLWPMLHFRASNGGGGGGGRPAVRR